MNKYGSGKAGQFAKAEATKRFHRSLNYVIAVCLLGGLIMGMSIGFSVFPYGFKHLQWAARVPKVAYWCGVLGTEVIGAILLFWLRHTFNAPMEKLSHERIRYLRGGHAEALVASMLESLNDHWHLFNGLAMKGGGDIDHVLVGPGGLFCISTKAYRGTYSRLPDGSVHLNGKPTKDVTEAQRLAITLRHWLEARLEEHHSVKSIPYVQPVLVAPFAHVDFAARAINVWIVDDYALLSLVDEAKPSLNPAVVYGCVAVLKDLTGWKEYARND